MHRISHRNHITPESIPEEIIEFIIKRFEQIVEDSDGETIPTIILVKPDDDLTESDYAFVGCDGLISDLLEEHKPREVGFVRPYEWVSYHADLGLYELLFLRHAEDGHWILIPEAIVELHPDLKWVLTAEELGGLSEPQPL